MKPKVEEEPTAIAPCPGLAEALDPDLRSEALGRLAGGVAHEFNNLLTVILACSHSLIQTLRSGDKRLVIAREICDAAERARRILACSLDEPVRPAAGGPETVLVVEDDRSIRAMVCRTLCGLGYTVMEAADAGEAEKAAGAIDLLLTDAALSDSSGAELARRMLSRRPGMKALLMSGYCERADCEEAGVAAGSAFLQKPFTTGALARKVRETLAENSGASLDRQERR